jgi:hypothetical protein
VAVVALLVVALFAVVRTTGPVQPADGPGSLPDRIYPAPSRMLTLQQSPIGRIGMLYAQPVVNGGSAWVAIGADVDAYRWVTPFDGTSDTVAVSDDGRIVAVGHADGFDARGCHVQVLDATTGAVRTLVPPGAPQGCRIDAVSLSPDGRLLATSLSLVVARDQQGWSGRSGWWEVDTAGGAWRRLDAVATDTLVGWLDAEPVFGSPWRQSVTDNGMSVSVGTLTVMRGGRAQRLGVLRSAVSASGSPASLSPDGRLIAGVSGPGDGATGGIGVASLVVYDVASGRAVRQEPLGRSSAQASVVVGWRDATTPVVSSSALSETAAVQPPPPGGVVALPTVRPPQVLTRAETTTVYSTARVAQDVLRGGVVRQAQPPAQPWYDPRILGPTVRDAVGPKGAGALVMLVLLGLAVYPSNLRRRRRHT